MGLLQACCHDPGGPGISAVVGIQMPAVEDDAVGGGRRSASQSRRQLFANAVIARVKTAECRLLARRGGSRGSEDCLVDHPPRFLVALAAYQHAIYLPRFPLL